MNSLNNYTEKELIQEIQRRINKGLIDWSFSYDYTTDFTSMALIANQQDYRLNFRQKMGIENSFMCRKIYIKLEPTLIKIREKQANSQQEEQQKKIMEALQAEFEKK